MRSTTTRSGSPTTPSTRPGPALPASPPPRNRATSSSPSGAGRSESAGAPSLGRRVIDSAIMAKAATIGELRGSGWQRKSVKQELRDNLIARLRRDERFLPGIVGYDETVVPQ